MTKTELKKMVAEVMKEMYNVNEAPGVVKSPVRTSYHVDTYDLSRTSRDPDAEREDVYQVKRITSDVQGDDYDEELVGEYDSKEEADAVAARLNNKDSNLKENEEVQYVEYVRDMSGEVPFLMGTKKFEYVWAKYPTGKLDIGVYAFGEDMVYAYEFFRKMYNISEDGGKPKNPVRKGKVSDKLEASTKSNNRYDGGVYLPPGLRENDEEFEKAYGTVTLNDVDYDYEVKVTLNISNHDEYHGQPEMNPEGVSEIEISDIDVISIEPEPATDSDESKVSKLIDADIREKYGSDM